MSVASILKRGQRDPVASFLTWLGCSFDSERDMPSLQRRPEKCLCANATCWPQTRFVRFCAGAERSGSKPYACVSHFLQVDQKDQLGERGGDRVTFRWKMGEDWWLKRNLDSHNTVVFLLRLFS